MAANTASKVASNTSRGGENLRREEEEPTRNSMKQTLSYELKW